MLLIDRKMAHRDIEDIFTNEFLPLADSLYGFAYSLVGNDQAAQDLVQDTWTKAIRSVHLYEEGTNAKAWLMTILRNSFINDYRKKSRRPNTMDIDEVLVIRREGEAGDVSRLAGYTDLRDEYYTNAIGDEVTNALERLSPEYRQIIALADIQEFKYEEIAEMLDMPIGTVRSRLFRARNVLKQSLRAYGDSLGYQDKR